MRIVGYVYKGYRGGSEANRRGVRYIFETTDDGASTVRVWEGRLQRNRKARAVFEIQVGDRTEDVEELNYTLANVISWFDKNYLNFRVTTAEILERYDGVSKAAARKHVERDLASYPKKPKVSPKRSSKKAKK